LRLAWLALPPWLLEPVMEAKRLADRHNPVLDQLVLADLLTSGAFDRHLRRCRLRHRRRRDRLGAAVAEHAPTLRLAGVAAGLHAVVPLPEQGPTEQEVVADATTHSVALDGLGATGTLLAHIPLAWSSVTPTPPGGPAAGSLIACWRRPPRTCAGWEGG